MSFWDWAYIGLFCVAPFVGCILAAYILWDEVIRPTIRERWGPKA